MHSTDSTDFAPGLASLAELVYKLHTDRDMRPTRLKRSRNVAKGSIFDFLTKLKSGDFKALFLLAGSVCRKNTLFLCKA